MFLIMGAKYDSSIMNDLHTVCLANNVGLPTKVVCPTTLFSKKKVIFYSFCVGHWPVNLEVMT